MLYTSDSKTVVETKSYIGDFRDVLVAGETIASQSVTVIVFSGDDTNPSHLLFQGITVHAGWIEQRIRLGIPGNIYTIKFEVDTSLGNTYDKVTRLAILPEDGSAVPQFTNLYETSCLYPYIVSDALTTSVNIISGRLPLLVINFSDALNSYVNISSGSLTPIGSITYTWNEGLVTGIVINGGVLTLVTATVYNVPPTAESLRTGVAILGGVLNGSTSISYDVPAEGLTTGITIISGTLA